MADAITGAPAADQPQVSTPDWVKDAVFYQIFPDRFAKSDQIVHPNILEPWDSEPTVLGYKGGDLRGVQEKLDYLLDLGINAIYFNPIFQSASNHRYHTHDYYQIDPVLGDNAIFKEMLDACHAKGIKVVLDGVFNHASRGFYQFNSILELGEASPYRDWFTVHGYPMRAYEKNHQYAAWWGLAALPKFNTDVQAVRDFLLGVGRYWMEQGIDGWRLDVPNEINDDEFWREFRRIVKGVNPEGYITGEIWFDASHWLQGDQYDSVMNYIFTKHCLGFFSQSLNHDLVSRMSYSPIRKLSASGFAKNINALLHLYPREVTLAQLNLLDSHDTPRFLSQVNEDESALRLATLYQMCYPGAPSVYYGDEIGMLGGRDPECRRSFPWDESKWNKGLRDFFKQTIALRKAHSALRRGEYSTLYAEGSLYVFARHDANETVIVALNIGTAPLNLSIGLQGLVPNGATVRAIFGGEGRAQAAGGRLRGLTVEPRSGLVLQVEK